MEGTWPWYGTAGPIWGGPGPYCGWDVPASSISNLRISSSMLAILFLRLVVKWENNLKKTIKNVNKSNK